MGPEQNSAEKRSEDLLTDGSDLPGKDNLFVYVFAFIQH